MKRHARIPGVHQLWKAGQGAQSRTSMAWQGSFFLTWGHSAWWDWPRVLSIPGSLWPCIYEISDLLSLPFFPTCGHSHYWKNCALNFSWSLVSLEIQNTEKLVLHDQSPIWYFKSGLYLSPATYPHRGYVFPRTHLWPCPLNSLEEVLVNGRKLKSVSQAVSGCFFLIVAVFPFLTQLNLSLLLTFPKLNILLLRDTCTHARTLKNCRDTKNTNVFMATFEGEGRDGYQGGICRRLLR